LPRQGTASTRGDEQEPNQAGLVGRAGNARLSGGVGGGGREATPYPEYNRMVTEKAERTIVLPFQLLHYRGFSSKSYFLELLRLTPANPNKPIPTKIKLVGSWMGNVPSLTKSAVN